MVNSCEDFENIVYVGGAYFHQDYAVLGATPEEIMEGFLRNEAPETVDGFREELATSLESALDEEQLKEIWLKCGGSSFDPSRHGMSYRQWFSRLLISVSDLG